MKIAEVKEAMMKKGFSDELFEEFKAALGRVPKRNRSQHLYTFAYEIATEKDCFKGAIEMIRYALKACENSCVDVMRAYNNLAAIYESREMYAEAYDAYASELESIPEEHRESYTAGISVRMMKAHLHAAKFQYTPCLCELYEASKGTSDFEAGFRAVIYYTAIAEMIISRHGGDAPAYAEAKKKALDALGGEKTTVMDTILARHKYKNEAGATEASLDFLKKSK